MNTTTESPTMETIQETKKCPDCLAEIPKAAKKCSHCGSKQKQHLTKFQVGVVLALAFIVVLPAFIGSGTSTPRSAEIVNTAPTGQQAFIISQSFVERILKSPATADFPSGEYNYDLVGEKTHVVTSYVDSENSFGANIRSSYTASMTFNGGDWADSNSWTLERLVFDGEEVYTKPVLTE